MGNAEAAHTVDKPSHPLRAGLCVGAIASSAAVLIQLPLHAPNDSFFNAGAVMLGALATGLLFGYLWEQLRRRPHGQRYFLAACGSAFVAALLVSMAGQVVLDRLVTYVVPLAALVLIVIGWGIPAMSMARLTRSWAVVLLLVGGAVVLGVLLAGQGDAASGHLEIPVRTP